MPVTEKELSRVSGLGREVFRGLRQSGELVEGEDWDKELSGIEYTEAGQGKLQRLLSDRLGVDGLAFDEAVSRASESPKGRVVEVTVTRLLSSRKRLLADHEGKRVVVQVRSNANFMPGMSIEAVPGDGALYYYHGKYPRRKGRM